MPAALRESLLAVALLFAVASVVIGVALISGAAAWIVAGPLFGAWALFCLGDFG